MKKQESPGFSRGGASQWVKALLRRFDAYRDHTTEQATVAVRDAFEDLDWYDDGAVIDAALDAAMVTQEAADAIAVAVDDFFDQLEEAFDDYDSVSHETRLPTFPRGDDPGANPIVVYTRPAEQYRYGRSTGDRNDEALERALRRSDQLVDQTLALAYRDAMHQNVQANPLITGYRRVVHPELSRTGTCGLCAVASTRIYYKAELLPLHDGCRCGVTPIWGSQDPGSAINLEDLGDLYEAASRNGSRGTAREDLRRIRVIVEQHGELGPVLVRDGQNWSPAHTRGEPDAIRRRAELNSLIRHRGLVKGDAAEWVEARIEYLRKL